MYMDEYDDDLSIGDSAFKEFDCILTDLEKPNTDQVTSSDILPPSPPQASPIKTNINNRESSMTQDITPGEESEEDVPHNPPPPIPPATNTLSKQTNSSSENLTQTAADKITPPKTFKGMLDKCYSGYLEIPKSRYFSLENGTMVYYEPVHWFIKGQFNLSGSQIIITNKNDKPNIIRLKVLNRGELLLKAKDFVTKQQWKDAIQEHIDFANYLSNNRFSNRSSLIGTKIPCGNGYNLHNNRYNTGTTKEYDSEQKPVECSGWLLKEGQIIPTVKRRFFILNDGIVKYYSKDISTLSEQEIQKARPLGSFPIVGYNLYTDNVAGRIELLLMPGDSSTSRRRLKMFCDDYSIRDKWVKSFNEHIAYNPL